MKGYISNKYNTKFRWRINIDLYNKFENIIDDGLITAEIKKLQLLLRRKEVTNNLNNHLVDSTSYVSLKETENQRNFYNKRLKIVTINPDPLSLHLI